MCAINPKKKHGLKCLAPSQKQNKNSPMNIL
jgi:hypothetical protein